jgi:hypothetical protein
MMSPRRKSPTNIDIKSKERADLINRGEHITREWPCRIECWTHRVRRQKGVETHPPIHRVREDTLSISRKDNQM